MGLDATVYCDCIETGQLHTPHPYPYLLVIGPDGAPETTSRNLDEQIAHDSWLFQSPCQHETCVFLHHRLGNVSGISELRDSIEQLEPHAPRTYPVLLTKVLYSSTHTGDFLSLEDVADLNTEVQVLRGKIAPAIPGEEISHLHEFLHQLEQLIAASRQVGKPISF